MPLVDRFAGLVDGPAFVGTSTLGAWFDDDDTTWGSVPGGLSTTWDALSTVTVDVIRIRWQYGGLNPGIGASAEFAMDVRDDPGDPWVEFLDAPDPPTQAGVSYPQDFELEYSVGAVGRFFRFRSTAAGNNDIFTVNGYEDVPDDPGAPPVDPGYEDPGTGHAILEIYVHDEDATRWGAATWGDNPPTGTTGIWSGAGWQDVTPQGVNAHVSWGTSRPDRGILAIQEAQSWLVTTYDPDRVLDPGNPDSPYAPQLVSGVPIRISSSVSGRVIRTGIIDRISYRYKAPDYRGTIQASSTIAVAWRAEVPEDSMLGDTLRERIRDAVIASGIAIGGIPLLGNDDSYPDVPLSPRIEGSENLWTHIYKAGEEVLWVIYEDAAGTLQARPWGGSLDRGSEITYANLEDLEAASTEDGVYSVVYVTDDTEPDPIVLERVAAPLPRYGRIPYRRDETTINAEAWADAVLADRAWPGVRWTPGTVWCFTAADVEFMASLEIMERVRIVVPGVIDVSGRLLGMEMWVEAKDERETRWLFLPRIATDGATSLGTTILVSDDTGDYLVDDDGDGEYLEYEG